MGFTADKPAISSLESAESSIIVAALQGKPEAWESLVRAHQQVVFRLCYLMLGDSDEAEDISQEAFLRAARALDRFDLSRPFRPWLLSIAANLARNRRRSIGRQLNALKRIWQSEPHPITNIEESTVQRWQAQTLWQAIRRLNWADQEVIYLRYFLEVPIEEVAESLGVAAGTVKSRLHRAVGRLRAIVDRDFPSLREAVFESGNLNNKASSAQGQIE